MTLEEVTTLKEAIKRLKEVIKEVRSTIQPFLYDNEAIDYIIKALEQPKWIPVSERLPASDEDVLVTNGRGIYIGWIDPTDKGWRVDSESEYFMNDIVAWMPLPAGPYEAESEDNE